MEKTIKACQIVPIDRDYNRHGGGRIEHLEFFREPVSYTIRAQSKPMIAIWEREPNENTKTDSKDSPRRDSR